MQYKNILISNNFYWENSGLLQEICVISESLSEISRELKCIVCIIFIIIIITIVIIIIIIIIVIIIIIII